MNIVTQVMPIDMQINVSVGLKKVKSCRNLNGHLCTIKKLFNTCRDTVVRKKQKKCQWIYHVDRLQQQYSTNIELNNDQIKYWIEQQYRI